MEITQAKAVNFIKGVKRNQLNKEVMLSNNPSKEQLNLDKEGEHKYPASVKEDKHKEHYDAGWVTGTKQGAMKALTKVFEVLKDYPDALAAMPVVDFTPKPKQLKKVQLQSVMDRLKEEMLKSGFNTEQLEAIEKEVTEKAAQAEQAAK